MEKETGKTPKALQAFPKLDARLGYAFKVFNRLDRARTYHMAGPNPISITDFNSYCELAGIHNVEFRLQLLELVQCLDMAQLSSASS